MKLEYELEECEIEESLLCLEWKREGKSKYVNLGIVGIIAAGSIIGYAVSPEQFFWLVLAGISVALMFVLLYVPLLRRKQKAGRIAGQQGRYRISVPCTGIQSGYESERVFTIKTGSDTYCIPKRVLSEEQKEEIRTIFNNHAKSVFQIVTGRSG